MNSSSGMSGLIPQHFIDDLITRADIVEVLGLASKLWREFGDQKKSAAVGQLAEKLSAGRQGAKKERAEKGEGLQRLKQLEEEVAKLKAALDKRLGELKELEWKLDR